MQLEKVDIKVRTLLKINPTLIKFTFYLNNYLYLKRSI